MAIIGTSGSDTLTGTAAKDTFDLTQGGDDTAAGLGGNDTFNFGATFTAADLIDGGAGNDTLNLAGDYSAGLTFAATSLTSIENIVLSAGNSYSLTLDNANVTVGNKLMVDGSALVAANKLTFDGSAETSSALIVKGGAGNDLLYTGNASDSFVLNGGGNDTVFGGAGSDTFAFGGAFTAADRVDGGTGNDTLTLNGDYSGANKIVLAAKTLLDVERMTLAKGHNYDIALNSHTVDFAGARLTVDASALTAANTLTLDGTAIADGLVQVVGGVGKDVIKMGDGFASGDRIDGGRGDDALVLSGNVDIQLAKATLHGIETIRLTAGAAYDIESVNATVAEDDVLTIDGSVLGVKDSVAFDGHRERDGNFALTGGAGDDVFTGGRRNDTIDLSHGGKDIADAGAGNDDFVLGKTLTGSDRIAGGIGFDTVMLDGTYNTALTADTLSSIEEMILHGGHNYTLTMDGQSVKPVGGMMTIDGSQLGAANALTLDVQNTAGTWFSIRGGAGDDVLRMHDGTAIIDISQGGNDTIVSAGAGDAVFGGNAVTAADKIKMAGGTLQLGGARYASGLTFNSNFNGAGSILLNDGFNYKLTVKNTNFDISSGTPQTMIISASGLTAANHLTFDGSSVTFGSFWFFDGAGNDVIKGSQIGDFFLMQQGGNDTVTGGQGQDLFTFDDTLTAADRIDGGGGADVVTIDGVYANLMLGATTLTGVEKLTLDSNGGNSYKITTADGNVASGAVLTVDGSALGAAETLNFNGSAETNGSFAIAGGAANDTLTGGAKNDTFDLSAGGSDTATGNGGNDTFKIGGNSTIVSINGGSGSDTLNIAPSTSAIMLGGNFVSIERVTGTVVTTSTITTADAFVGTGKTMAFDISALDLTFDGSAETNGAFAFTFKGGEAHLEGGSGADNFIFGIADFFPGATQSSFDSADTVDGRGGNDTVTLTGDTPAGVLDHLTSVEKIVLTDGYTYDLSGHAASGTLIVDASGMSTGGLTFDPTAGADNPVFTLIAGDAAADLNGGNKGDTIELFSGSGHTVDARDGNDTIVLRENGFDTIDGGAGSDTLLLDGNFSAGYNLTGTTAKGIEEVDVAAGHDYKFSVTDDLLTTGQGLIVDASNLGGANAMQFDASFETSGVFSITGGDGDDIIIAGGGSDIISGHDGNDTITAGGGTANIISGGDGADTFVYGSTVTSTGLAFDTITDMDFSEDDISLDSGPTVIDGALTGDFTIDDATFETDLSNVLSGNLSANGAILVTPESTGGCDFDSRTLLVVDMNGVAGYQNGDLVIEVTGFNGTMTLGSFIS